MSFLPSNAALRAGFLLAAASLVALYALLGEAVAVRAWNLGDVAGEGGVAAIAAGWLWLVLDSRPAGRVTARLATGLAGVSLGAWCDCLDEFFVIGPGWPIDNWLESTLMPAGMLMLTVGLLGWRREQFQLSEHMAQRERLFREHRAFDRITELADADYLRDQLALEALRSPLQPAALLMVEAGGIADVLRGHGRRDAVRALRTVTHQLLLNLRNDDLLCRYAGERFLILMPRTALAEAERSGAHLQRMVRATAFRALGDSAPLTLELRVAAVLADGPADALLEALNRRLEADAGALAVPA